MLPVALATSFVDAIGADVAGHEDCTIATATFFVDAMPSRP